MFGLMLMTSCRPHSINHFEGQAFGTMYSITYIGGQNGDSDFQLHLQIDSLLADLSHTFSIFDSSSIIYRWNKSKEVELNEDFLTVLRMSKTISTATDGAFDCTVQPLVQLWGFGKDGVRHTVSEDTLAAVREFVGFQLVDFQGDSIIRKNPRVQLNFNAVAKGYAVDKVADWLVVQGYTDCLVEIGGEVAARGDKNGRLWKVGIQTPTKTTDGAKESFESIPLPDHRAVATSGNYRNYFEENGVRYTHILDPRTGKPERTNLLSVTVLAPDCATADAYATAFMVLGYDRASEIVRQNPELEAWFIIAEGDGKWKVETVRNNPETARYVAQRIYTPSYISLHTALSFYGIIPEAVTTITSVTSNRPAAYSNDFGEFSYQTVKPALFFGYKPMILSPHGSYMLAFPEKAILDLLYLYPQYNTKEALQELRLDEWWMQEELNRDRLLEFSEQSGVKALQTRVKLLLKTYCND